MARLTSYVGRAILRPRGRSGSLVTTSLPVAAGVATALLGAGIVRQQEQRRPQRTLSVARAVAVAVTNRLTDEARSQYDRASVASWHTTLPA